MRRSQWVAFSALGLAFSLIVSGCFQGMGKKLGRGAVEGLQARGQIDSLATKVGRGLVRGAADTTAQERLTALVDRVGDRLTPRVTALRDSLLGDYTQLWLRQQREDLLGESTKQRLGAIRADLLGEKTRALLGNIRDDLLGDATRMQAVALATLLRDELLNSTTRKALDAIVASAVKTSAEGYEAQWRPRLREDADFLKDRVREEEGFLKKHVTKLLWTAGGIVALLLVLGGLIFARGWRYRKILEVLTYQIHKIPDQPAYDELTRRIREKAQEVGVEPHLRKLLQKRGILGKESWTPPA